MAKFNVKKTKDALTKAHAEKPFDGEHLAKALIDSVPERVKSKDKLAEMFWANIPENEEMKTRTDEANWKEFKDAFQGFLNDSGKEINNSSDRQSFINAGKKLGKMKPIKPRKTKVQTIDIAALKTVGNEFSDFAEAMQSSNIDADTLAAAIEIVAMCDSVAITKQYAEKWSALVAMFNGDTSKAQQAVALLNW